MAEIEGCNFPEEGIMYDIDSQMWVRFDDDGSITSGLTDIAQHIAGNILYLRPRKIGTDVSKGKRVAIIESGKYVGPINAPLSGKIIEVNQKVLDNAGAINEDCYGEGWVLRIKPSSLEVERDSLVEGKAALVALREKLGRESWDCF
ncbi:MAG: glycine cleavage system protein H [Thermoleophilia bacterium]|nr:glycine cleavage system protein H [Thermoleophilia bacterium]